VKKKLKSAAKTAGFFFYCGFIKYIYVPLLLTQLELKKIRRYERQCPLHKLITIFSKKCASEPEVTPKEEVNWGQVRGMQ
jgi:hypothetical protein